MQLDLPLGVVRSYRTDDIDSLATHANNRKIWLGLRDAFPYPYGKEDARAFIERSLAMRPETFFAIALDSHAVGGIGFRLHQDVERVSAELGYWLGEPFWGRGITTEAVRAVTSYAIDQHQLTRVYAVPYEWNLGSCRVLEKAGYQLEGRMRRSAIKDGRVVDQFLYARVP
ncbi:MAG: GNAT family N-acetyltransferase [Gemmatimonadetes bacterium]|nr:GNAT family N-acetyltransferase [Gemmatimonadota bacterium]